MCLLQGWGRCAGADLPGCADRASGHEEPPAPSCPCRTTGCQDQLPDCLDLCHRCVSCPLPRPFPGAHLFGSGKTQPETGKAQVGRSPDLGQGGQSPKCPATVPLPKAQKSSAARIPISCLPSCWPGLRAGFTFALSPFAARNALVVLFAGLVAYSFQVMGSQPFRLTGSIPQGLPAFRPPRFSLAAPNGTVPFQSMVEVGAGSSPGAALLPPACAGSRPSLTGSFPPRTWGSGWPWCRSWACWRPSPSPRLLVGLRQGPALCSQGGLCRDSGCWGGVSEGSGF